MLRFRALSLTCCCVVAAAQLAAAQSKNATVRGTVTDSTHAPIVRATVHVGGTALGAVTDADGHFTVSGVPAGRYTIKLQRAGFAPDSFSVILNGGATVDRDVHAAFGAAASGRRHGECVAAAERDDATGASKSAENGAEHHVRDVGRRDPRVAEL